MGNLLKTPQRASKAGQSRLNSRAKDNKGLLECDKRLLEPSFSIGQKRRRIAFHHFIQQDEPIEDRVVLEEPKEEPITRVSGQSKVSMWV
jgi:hypothetical protein